MEPGLVFDLAMPPSAALTRIAAAINQRPKRAFGVLKTQDEFIGHVSAEGFEIWERKQRAVHAVADITARGRGTRVEIRFVIPRITRVMLAVFFALYALVAGAIASQPAHREISLADFFIAATGAIALGLIFYGAGRSQRRHLADFLTGVFSSRSR